MVGTKMSDVIGTPEMTAEVGTKMSDGDSHPERIVEIEIGPAHRVEIGAQSDVIDVRDMGILLMNAHHKYPMK